MSSNKTPTPRRQLGDKWEARTQRYLQRHGLACIAKNFHSRFGEIDLVMLDEDTLVFVEVRYRGAGSRINAALSVDRKKQQKLQMAALYFISRHPQWGNTTMRFDVVAIDQHEGQAPRPRWIKDAFRV